MFDAEAFKASTKQTTVLYVEDNETVRLQTLMLLQTLFETIDSAENGQEGLKKYSDYFEENGFHYDLVITDIRMPVMNGIEMSGEILALNEDQKIVVISAYNEVEYLFELINLGVTHFLSKPIEIDQFTKMIAKTCQEIEEHKLVNSSNQEIRHLNEELTQNNVRLQEALDIVDEHIIYSESDLAGNITAVSSAFCKISGYSKEELIGKPHNVVRHPDMPSVVFKELWETIRKQQVWQGEVFNLAKNGKTYYVYATVKPKMYKEGKMVGYISVRQDITHQKESELQKEQLVHQSRHASMGEMISIIAHQWKQPLNHLSMELYHLRKQLKRETVDVEKVERHYRNSENILANLSDIITTFKKFFKPTTAMEELSLGSVMETSLVLIQPMIDASAVQINIENNEIDDRVLGYGNEISQAFVNILKNSIDELIAGEVETPLITIRFENMNGNVTVTICDNGSGVPEENLSKLFDPYFSTKGEQGTGMGLYMVRVIVEEKLKGKIRVTNNNPGLCTQIKLPSASKD